MDICTNENVGVLLVDINMIEMISILYVQEVVTHFI